ncbi:hypothetical protein N7520_003522 [Penicillium odoratum]|uniref:uncharacterized protein n=1 Tax=Penicillium odoratum TaxID=1167516 RepID=UPI00254861E2|nr:uncharacterized protein N7520_003522 [Penicillium odoratum]KAJ5768963.1 hypothetical protein N7520_003522 [Penicillium odoratum]
MSDDMPFPTPDPDNISSSSPSTPVQTVNVHPSQTAPRLVGLPIELPPPWSGDRNEDPRDWANFVMNEPFKFPVAVQGKSLRGKIIGQLLKMESLREPVIRFGRRKDWDAKTFYTHVNSSLANVEAIIMQIVGKANSDPEAQCSHCRKNTGPFVMCVQVELDGVMECANCHWDKQRDRCSFGTPSVKKSRRSSKLMIPEKLLAIDNELASILKARQLLNEKMIAFRDQLLASQKLLEDAYDGNPQRQNPSSENFQGDMHKFFNILSSTWLRKITEGNTQQLASFSDLMEEYMVLDRWAAWSASLDG